MSFIFTLYDLDPFILGPLMTLLIIPTVITLVVRLPRLVRDLNKALLGLNTGLALVVIILHPLLIVKAIVILVLVPASLLVNKHRSIKDHKTCSNCPEFDKWSSYECSGTRSIGDRMSLIHVIDQSQIPDGLKNANQEVTKFEDL
jgi:hypothetical protein